MTPEVNDLPAALNIRMYAGATFRLTLTYKLGSPALPVDLSNYTADMAVRERRAADADPDLIRLTTENGRITLGGVAGTVALLVTDEDTATLTAGSHVYDLLLTEPSGAVVPLVSGTCTVRTAVTQ